MGCRIDGRLPRAKSGYRDDRRAARDILSVAQKDAIYELCRAEFELLGYRR